MSVRCNRYGLPERPGARSKLEGTKLISNPGCYATGGQVGLMPLFQGDSPLGDPDVAPYIFGVSGYSGAGTTPSPKNDPVCLKDNLLPYALAGHIHEREASWARMASLLSETLDAMKY